MTREQLTNTGPAFPFDPKLDRPRGTMPERIAALLHVVRILLGYGRHLADTLKVRAATPGFTAIAACFGTTNICLIRAHLDRGILRAAALERVLLARAASGRDIKFGGSRIRTSDGRPAPADPASKPVAHNTLRPVRSNPQNHSADFHTPTLEELELQVRRRPLGRTIVDICLDLAAVPGLCTGTFWNELFDVMQCYGGSLTNLMRERVRREQAFHQKQDITRTQDRDRSNLPRQLVRQVLGFFIGEEPALPFCPSAPGRSGHGADHRPTLNGSREREIYQASPATAMMVVRPADMPRNDMSGDTSIHSSSE